MKKTYDDEDEEIKILWALIRFADHNKGFKRKYVDDIYDFYEENGLITNAQLEVLAKIHKENNVHDFFDELEETHQMEPNY